MGEVNSVDNEPEWLLYRKGINYYNSTNFSEAFKYFREASRTRDFPEAEYYLGRIFENEGEFSLALKQYERAEEFSENLFVPSFTNEITLKKAAIYKKLKKYNLYQEMLEKLIKKLAEEKEITRYMSLLPEKLLKSGLDELFYYYRINGDELIHPSGELGVYFYQLSQDNNAIRYLTPSVIIIMTKVSSVLKNYDPAYTYKNLTKFITDAENFSDTAAYISDSQFYKYFFHLSLSLHNTGKTDETYRLLKIICDSSYSGKYRDLSDRIIRNRKNPSYIEKVKKTLQLPVE
jgi:tetratricopeptide (TPR) repeat protein